MSDGSASQPVPQSIQRDTPLATLDSLQIQLVPAFCLQRGAYSTQQPSMSIHWSRYTFVSRGVTPKSCAKFNASGF